MLWLARQSPLYECDLSVLLREARLEKLEALFH